MIGSIFEKLADASSMFWAALDFGERRIVAIVGLYLALVFMGICWRVLVASLARDIREQVAADEDITETA